MADASSRIEQIQAAMEAAGVDAVVLRLAENIVLATRWYVQIPGARARRRSAAPAGGRCSCPEYEAAEAADDLARRHPHVPGDPKRRAGAPGGEIERHLRDAGRRARGQPAGVVGFEGSFESIAPGSIHGEPNAVALPDAGADQATRSQPSGCRTSPRRSSRCAR